MTAAATNTINDISLDKMNPAIMLAAIKKLELKGKPKTADQMQQALRKHFESKLPLITVGGKKVPDRDQLLKCSTCGGFSSNEFASCPYCGDGETTEAQAEPGKLVEATGETVEDKVAPAQVEAEAPKTTKRADGKNYTRKLKPVPNPPPSSESPAPGAIVPAGDAQAELNAAVNRVLAMRNRTAESLYELGLEIRDIYKRELWTQRLNEDGKQKYTRFSTFCESELGVSKTTAHGLMDAVSHFTKAELEKHGASKLKLLVSMPETERQKLLENGASRRDIERARRGSGSGAGASSVTPGDVMGAVTVVVRVTEEPVVMAMNKAHSANGKGAKKLKPATSLTDLPWCEEQHENGVISRYAVVVDKDSGQLMLQRQTRRA